MKIATPISHLFKEPKTASQISDVSDCLEFRDHSIDFQASNTELYHSDLQLIHPMKSRDINELREIQVSDFNLKCISFHAASCFAIPSLEEGIFTSGQKLASYEEMVENSQRNADIIRDIFGTEIKILVENNNFYPTPAYEHIANPRFITEIVKKSRIDFLYDIAHAKISAHNMEIPYEDYKSLLPLDNIYQVHICKYGIDKNNLAFDAHEVPNDIEFAEVQKLSENGKLKYLTIEYYESGEILIDSIKKLKTYVRIS